MANFVDVQYATMLAGRFQQYKVKHRNPLKINFRCPICGDSQKSRTKSRGWITEMPKTGQLHYTCFNCGASESFSKFAKMMDQSLYNDYIADRYLDKTRDKPEIIDEKAKTETPDFKKNPLSAIKKISQLKHDHPVKQYIEKRQIPTDQHYRLYYAPKFMTWINSLIPNKFENIKKDEPRLIMPLIDKDGKVFGVSARAFDPKSLRYITIMFDEKPKIFGLDTVDFNKRYFVTEGGLDSMFLSNSVAMVGADARIEGLDHLENAIFVHDAEPRNLEICNRMEKLLKQGRKICIWPSSVPAKDINDMHLKGMKYIEKVIIENTYQGLIGQLKMKEWRKCG
jgi:transcription elongation factor Elf1